MNKTPSLELLLLAVHNMEVVKSHRLSVNHSVCKDHTPETLQKVFLPVKKGKKNLS